MPEPKKFNFNESLDSITEKILPKSSVNFWLIRTEGGELFEEFYAKKRVGLINNSFTNSELSELRKNYSLKNGQLRYKALELELDKKLRLKRAKEIDKVKKQYGDKSSALTKINREIGLDRGQILKFAFALKKGDYVVIPSEGSHSLAIGIIDNSFLLDSIVDGVNIEKSIKWVKKLNKSEIEPNFFRLFFAHQAINDINKYRDIILRASYDFYFDDTNANLVLNVQRSSGIISSDFFGYGYNILELFEDFCQKNQVDFKKGDINVITNLNSPGFFKYFSFKKRDIVLFAIFVLAINGGGIKLNNSKVTFNMSTDGLINVVNDYLNDKSRRDLVNKVRMQKDSLYLKDVNDVKTLLEDMK